ncbi:uroporphyrinogen-III C-methyltransferase [Glaciecola sp. KUL10]|uniref:uroporphyrinogen-III C-methyltransferase n=1 Tax=Glaciecola sp. (strain KUL10) TaxID=2161813 RepID=UPI000D78B6FE|nr:uroporphyrinogen-III C-methyltransferase [Glaciecola sp. KUL10]GBL03532.1 siroheme synthase [Glaciecola sp. KUL10]
MSYSQNVVHTIWTRAFWSVRCEQVIFKLFGFFRTREQASPLGLKRTKWWGATLFATTNAVDKPQKGHVLLVGSGPGDPDLLTIKAIKAIQQADVVLVDWLVNREIVNLIPRHIEQRFVGKRAGLHSMKQEDINALMVSLALSGKNVVRLKGGDPAVFGRTAEETSALDKAGINYAIIPGITAASGASAYTGIPLTLRGKASSVKLITAHLKNPQTEPNWVQLASALENETIVFYMGLARLSSIQTRLRLAGVGSDMPVAVVDQATTRHQQSCIGNLSDIQEKVQTAGFMGPSLIIVGEAVSNVSNISSELLRQVSESAIKA